MATERHNNKKGFLEIWASSQDQDFGHPHHKNRPMPREKGNVIGVGGGLANIFNARPFFFFLCGPCVP